MVKGRVVPTGWGMTGLAGCPKLAVMFVIFLMAIKTSRWRTFEDIIGMAFFTCYIRMFAFQFEGSQVVIKLGGSPRFRRMTDSAGSAKRARVRVILLVTGSAISGRGFEVCGATRICVTFDALQIRVLAAQSKKRRVVEIFPIAVNAVMAGDTFYAVCQIVCVHKNRVNLTVTFIAGLRRKIGDAILVTVMALKRLI